MSRFAHLPLFLVSVLPLACVAFACSSDPEPAAPAGDDDDAPAVDAGNDATVTEPEPELDAGTDAADAADASDAAVDLGPLYLPAGYTELPIPDGPAVHTFAAAEQVLQPDTDYVTTIDTSAGRLVLDLYEADCPITVNSFVFLAQHHFYDQIAFHRVIDDFMAQTGDPNTISGLKGTWGTGGPGYQFGLEVKPELTFDAPGVLGMARGEAENTNGSQFFITVAAASFLDQQYTVWGKVLEGLDTLPAIVRGEPPKTPTRILRVGLGIKPK